MKVGKLINELIKLKKEHGDLEVGIADPDDLNHRLYEFGSVTFGAPGMGPSQGHYTDRIMIWHWFGPFCRDCTRGCD